MKVDYRKPGAILVLVVSGLMLLTSIVVVGCGGETPAEMDAEGSAAGELMEGETHAGEEGEEHGHTEEEIVRLTSAELTEFGIKLETAGAGEMRVEKTFPGEVRVNEDRYAHVVPRVPGVVRSVRASLGEVVRTGDVMAVLESRELADAKADYLAQFERRKLAQANFEREQRLYEKKISSGQDYLEAKQALAEADIRLRSARQQLRALGFSEAYIEQLPQQPAASLVEYPLTAPLSGTVIEKHIVQGETLEADAEAFEVADLSTVWVDLSIYQEDMALIQEGQTVVISSGGHRDRGKISYVRPIVGEDTRTALARVVVPNPHGRWKPGMFVNGTITIDASEVPVVVPKTALQTVNDETVVFVKTAEGFEPRPVTFGEENSDQVAITSGLVAGDEYAASGSFTLKAQLSRGDFEAGHSH